MPLDEIEQKLVHLQNQIDNLQAMRGKNEFSNTILISKELRTLDYESGSQGIKINPEGADITQGTIGSTDVSDLESRANILYDDYLFIGFYDDGLTEVAGGGGAISRQLLRTAITSDGNDVYLSSTGAGITAANDYEVNFSAHLTQIITQDVFMGVTGNAAMGVPLNSTYAANHFGFMVEDGKLYASTGDGAQDKSSEITGITLTSNNTYRIVHTAGVSDKFYINDTLEATLTANVPGAGLDPSLYFGIISQAGPAGRTLRVLNNYIIKTS
jgi:hypothetical protein